VNNTNVLSCTIFESLWRTGQIIAFYKNYLDLTPLFCVTTNCGLQNLASKN